MNEVGESVFHFRKLLELMEEDLTDISNCFQGEILEEYRETIKKEMDILKNTINFY